MSFRVDLAKETAAWAEKLDEGGAKATARLDDKSQQTGAVAGVFLAAALGFLKPDSFAHLGPHSKAVTGLLLCLGVFVLLSCIGVCLSVTWLRTSPIPIALSVMRGLMEDILAFPEQELDDSVQINMYRERLRLWQEVLADRLKLNKSKARRLKAAQGLLAIGILLISGLLLVVIRSIVIHR